MIVTAFLVVPLAINGQQLTVSENDSIGTREEVYLPAADTIVIARDTITTVPEAVAVESKESKVLSDPDEVAGKVVQDTLLIPVIKTPFSPDPNRAILYSAICPGLGQIYNRKYWKLPLVYGSFLGCAYAISWNSTMYNDYKSAYNDFTDDDPDTNSWETFRPNSSSFQGDVSTWPESNKTWFRDSRLKRGRDYYRRYRDLSYIITVGVYAIWIIDAYVDAQLFDFDIGEDLTFRMEPVILDRNYYAGQQTGKKTVGLQCSFRF